MMDTDHNEAYECGERLWKDSGSPSWRFARALFVHYFGVASCFNSTPSPTAVLPDPLNTKQAPLTVMSAMRRIGR